MNTTNNFNNNSLVGRSNKKIAYLLIFFGSISFILSVVNLLLGDFPSGWFGSLGILIGYLYLKNPCFSYENGELCIYNFWGKKIKKYPLNSLSELIVENNKIYFQGNEKRTKIPLSKNMVEQDDWETLMKEIQIENY